MSSAPKGGDEFSILVSIEGNDMTVEIIDYDEEDILDVILQAMYAHGIVEIDPTSESPSAYRLTDAGRALGIEAVKALMNLPTDRDRAN